MHQENLELDIKVAVVRALDELDEISKELVAVAD